MAEIMPAVKPWHAPYSSPYPNPSPSPNPDPSPSPSPNPKPFAGGASPDFADVCVFGCLSAIDRTTAFGEIMAKT